MRKLSPIQKALADAQSACRHLAWLARKDPTQLQTVPLATVREVALSVDGLRDELQLWLNYEAPQALAKEGS